MDSFKKEVKAMFTEDIMLILNDQQDLYTDEEIDILKAELKSRPEDAIEKEQILKDQLLEERYDQELYEKFQQEEKLRLEKERIQRSKKERHHKEKIDNLKKNGADGYYEYKVISLLDQSGLFNKESGAVDVAVMTETLNELGIDGWHLVTAYSNELGKNHLLGGLGGAVLGVNSTIDENILIFERFVRIQ